MGSVSDVDFLCPHDIHITEGLTLTFQFQQLLNDDKLKAEESNVETELLEKLLQVKEVKETSPRPAESSSQDGGDKNTMDTSTPSWGNGLGPPRPGMAAATSGVSASSETTFVQVEEPLLSKYLQENVNWPQAAAAADRPTTNLEMFLTNLCNKRQDGEDHPRGTKRSASDVSADSTESSMDAEPSTSTRSTGSKLMRQNVLLAELLSQRAPHETVVNTQHTVSPGTTPQTRLPKNVSEKIIESNNNNNHSMNAVSGASSSGVAAATVASVTGSDNKQAGRAGVGGGENSGKKPTIFDNPLTNPNSPFPGNTNKDKGVVPDSGSDVGKVPMSGLTNLGIPNSMTMVAHSTQTAANSTTVTAVAAMGSSSMVTSTNVDTSGVTSSTDSTTNDPFLSQVT